MTVGELVKELSNFPKEYPVVVEDAGTIEDIDKILKHGEPFLTLRDNSVALIA